GSGAGRGTACGAGSSFEGVVAFAPSGGAAWSAAAPVALANRKARAARDGSFIAMTGPADSGMARFARGGAVPRRAARSGRVTGACTDVTAGRARRASIVAEHGEWYTPLCRAMLLRSFDRDPRYAEAKPRHPCGERVGGV